MNDKHKGTHLSNTQVITIWQRIVTIKTWNYRRSLNVLQSACPDTTKQIALDFNIDRKTVNRIASQECYRSVTEAYERTCKDERANHPLLGKVVAAETPASIIELSSEIINFKHTASLRQDLPMDYGYYRGWDRFHNVVSDGSIALHDDYGLELAVKAKASGITESPFFADEVREMPIWTLFDLMTQEVGTVLSLDIKADGIAYLLDDRNNPVALAQTYYELALRLKCEIRNSPDQPFLYLVKSTPAKVDKTSGKISQEDETIKIVAAVAIMNP